MTPTTRHHLSCKQRVSKLSKQAIIQTKSKPTSSKSPSLTTCPTAERSKSSFKKNPSQRKLNVRLYTKEVKPLLDTLLPNSAHEIARLDNIIHDEPSEKSLHKAFLKMMGLLHDSLQEQQNLTSEIAILRGFAECGDLVNERMTKYRTAWVKKFSNKPVPEIVELWAKVGGSVNRTCTYSSKLFDAVRQKHPKIKDESELWNRYEIVAGWIHFYASRCEYFHSNIEKKKKKPEQLLALLNDILDKFDRGLYEFTLPEYHQYVRMAVEELRDKHFEKDGDVWKSTWTKNPVGGSTEHESIIERESQQKTLKTHISKKRTRAGEPENGDDEIVNDPPPTITSKKRKIPDDDAPPTAKILKKRKFPDRTRTAADESMTPQPDDENSETHVTAKQSKKRAKSNTKASPADKEKFAVKSKKCKVDI